MNDESALTELLRCVDDPAPDPTAFKSALRVDLQETLQRKTHRGTHRSAARFGVAVEAGTPDRGPRGWTRAIAVAAGVAMLAVALVAVIGPGRDARQPVTSTESLPTPATTTDPTTTIPTVASACSAYAAIAPSSVELERFAETADVASAPDLIATAEALEELAAALVTGDLISDAGARSLRIAAGAMAQADAELRAGAASDAANSVSFSLRELDQLSDPPDAVNLPGCGFSE